MQGWTLVTTMNPQEQERYSRQIKLPQVGSHGQQRLLDAEALIIGMGGLGSPVALYLASAGIGRLTITDFDRVDESNLQRQVIHTQEMIGRLKAESARHAIEQLNPECKVEALDYELDGETLLERVRSADVVVDCTDNFPSRFDLNNASLATGTPLVSGAAIRWEGQVTTFRPRDPKSPCYRCLYPDTGIEAATCAMEGVIAPIVGVIGTLQALETLNVLLETGQGLSGRVMVFDGIAMEWQTINLPRNPNCPACTQRPTY
jgi:adenylyltransferase/sulfurtransferase